MKRVFGSRTKKSAAENDTVAGTTTITIHDDDDVNDNKNKNNNTDGDDETCDVIISPHVIIPDPTSLKSLNSTTTTISSRSNSSILEKEIINTNDNINVVVSNNNKGTTTDTTNSDILQTNIQVCARIRPLIVEEQVPSKNTTKRRSFLPIPTRNKSSNQQESSKENVSFVAWDVSDETKTASQSSKTTRIQGRTHSYTLDRIYDSQSSTKQIYDQSVSSLVNAAMSGYHSTILAYGQTSTGKTYTMSGTKNSPGLVPLCIQDCFRYVENNTCHEPREYLFRLSYLEIYKEHIRDLLSSKTPPEPVRMFDGGPNGLIIRGLKEEVVTSPEQVIHLLKQGDKRRQVGATHMNQHSSRSHVMVRLWIESTSSTNKYEKEATRPTTRISSLSLVDLAGSESVRLNGAERREEGHYINKSLMTLGQVVLSLSDAANIKSGQHQQQHIPYRDSKLTRLLQPSLSGNAQMLLLCCISPLASHLEESHNTFKFATRAKRIEQKATIQTASDNDETLLQTYRDEIEDLKQQLAEAKEQRRLLEEEQKQNQAAANVSTVMSSGINVTDMESATGEIKELVDAIQNMEKLILKSRPNSSAVPPAQDLDKTLASILLSDDEDDDDDSEELLIDDDRLKEKVPRTPPTKNGSNGSTTEDQLHSELTRIRGLLGSVLQKRGVMAGGSAAAPSPDRDDVRRNLDFGTPRKTPDRSLTEELDAAMDDDDDLPFDEIHTKEEKKMEVETLRKQLEQQERTTNLRKADSSFLQSQLAEKDKLLEEVSNLLEAVEQRQIQLERENEALKRELNALKNAK
jgi:centromeric protein E